MSHESHSEIPERTPYVFTPGGSFILDGSDRPASWWGAGDNIIGADGEALLIAGGQGTGKTTVAQQLALGRAGLPEYANLLGYPVTPTRGRVLYLAMDRPRQIARSLRRMVGEAMRAELDDKLTVWEGPPPHDLARDTRLLTVMAQDAGATHVIVDSLKDAAMKLSEDEGGAAWNRARQTALHAGVNLTELHHSRKADRTGAEKPSVDSIYGSTWITSGAGSVLLLNGAPGDPIINLHHVKQPMAEIGPLKITHEPSTGSTTIWETANLVALARATGGLSALAAAEAMFDTDKPDANQKAKARRSLQALTRAGELHVIQEGDPATKTAELWGAK